MSSQDEQETFFAIYNIGKVKEALEDLEGAVKSYFKAHAFRPTRAEPLFRAAVCYRNMGNLLIGYLLSQYALAIPRPHDTCIEYQVYDYALSVEFANCALLLGKWEEGLKVSCALLSNDKLPQEFKSQVAANCDLALSKLQKLEGTAVILPIQ